MKRYILLGIACVTSLILTSCASNNNTLYKAQVRNDLVQENWINHVTLNPNNWTNHADKWFYTDEPRNFNEFDAGAPAGRAITAMMVRVPDFNNIKVDGPYRVQIYGGQLHNTLYVLGPNEAARHTAVEIKGNTLFIHPATECGKGCGNPNDVIVRIGIHDLANLHANGSGLIEGKLITSSGLNIKSTNSSEILLTGEIRLQRVFQASSAPISIIGAYSPEVDVKIINNGNVNLSGRIGIRHILKQGRGDLNIIGADSDSLDIKSSGSGMTTINGYVNLRKIDVTESSRVYLYWVNSNGIYINLNGSGRLGLAGSANNIDVEVGGNARFEGKYLRAENVYIRTSGSSHANVTPRSKLFANAMDNSSIYFFGSPNVVSRYTSGNGIVIPVFNDACPVPMAPVNAHPMFKDETPFTNSSPYKGQSSSATAYPPATPYSPAIPYKGERNFKNESPYQLEINKGMRH
jgi:hypothetical protein